MGGRTPRQEIVPTGAGSPRQIATPPSLADFDGTDWFPDGRRVIYSGKDANGHSRIYVQQTDSNVATPITPPGVSYPILCKCLSPDGRFVIGLDDHGQGNLYPTGGGAPKLLPKFLKSTLTRPMQWTADGKKIIVYDQGALPISVELYDVADGKRTPLLTFNLPDPAGFRGLQRMRASADMKTIVYSYRRDLSRLVLVHGLK